MPIKKNQYSSPAQKTLALFYMLLFSGRRHYLTQLSDACHCSKQTISRMIEQISLTGGVEIESGLDSGRKWYRLKTSKPLPGLMLQPDDIRRLLMCRDMVWHLLPEKLRDGIGQTILRTTSMLSDQDRRSEALEQVACSRIKGAIDYTPYQKELELLSQAIGERSVCLVEYKAAGNNEVKTHHFAPIRLLAYHEALYAGGFLVTDKGKPEIRYRSMLAVHRMQSVTLTKRFHEFKDDQLDCNETFGIMEGDPFRVKVKFEPEVAAYISERQWSSDQKLTHYKNGRVDLEFTACSRPEVISWVLSFGTTALLLSPADLKKELKEEAMKMLGRY